MNFEISESGMYRLRFRRLDFSHWKESVRSLPLNMLAEPFSMWQEMHEQYIITEENFIKEQRSMEHHNDRVESTSGTSTF